MQSLQNYQIRVIALNACGRSNTASTHIRGTVPAPAAITGSTIACPGQTSTYSIPPIPGSSGYTWTLIPSNAGTISGQGGLTINITWAAGFSSATLCANGITTFNLAGPQTCINISNNAPTPGAVSGNPTPCSGNTQTYTISAVAGASGYLWTTTIPNATVVPAPNGLSAAVTFPAGAFSGSVCVSSTTTCGVSPASCLPVVNGVPGIPGPITGPASGVCNMTGLSYFLSTSDANSYNWTSSSPSIVIASGNGTNSVLIDYLPGFTSGTITVQAIYDCGSSYSNISVSGTPDAPSITPTVICPGYPEVYFAASTGATSFNWVATGTIIDYCTNANCSQYYVEWDMIGTSLSVTASNSCGTSAPFNAFSSCRVSNAGPEVNVYPNPSLGQITVEFTSSTSSSFNLELTDLTGRVIRSEELKAVAGTNYHPMDLGDLRKGMYAVRMSDNSGNVIVKRITLE
jgi:hypothetical protein